MGLLYGWGKGPELSELSEAESENSLRISAISLSEYRSIW